MNHEFEWDDYDSDYDPDEGWGGGLGTDPLHHHGLMPRSWVEVHETDKATLFMDDTGEFWVPKSLIRVRGGNKYVWNGFKKKYVGEVQI